jgi:hypothetical protein
MNNYLNCRAILAASLVACLSIASAQAQDMKMLQSCRSDVKTLCSSVQPGGGRVADCLKTHEAELSANCKSVMTEVSACGAEVKKTCGADASSPNAVRTCLNAHASEFSAACLSSLQKQ